MSDQLDAICDLVGRLVKGEMDDTRPDTLKAITKAAPTCEPYTRFFYTLCEMMYPDLILELGTDRGRSGIHFAMGAPEAKVFSVDIDPTCSGYLDAFKLPNVETITANSADASIAARFDDLSLDILFIDSLHQYAHVRRELDLYVPKVRVGGLIFMDDIHLGPEMERIWSEIGHPKREISQLHFTGFGVFEAGPLAV